MEALDDHLVRSNDRAQIIKGKRTKRQRSLSPINTTTTTTTPTAAAVVVPAAVAASSSSISGGIRVGFVDDENYASSSGEIQVSTEEEEDMANCLIMLARGEIRFSKKKKEKKKSDLNSNLNSRKFDEIVTANPSNKAGFYVYECKTCNRSFPSFQALGGHRASHKKPKSALTTPEEKPKSPSLNNEEKTETNSITSRASNNNTTNTTHTNKTNKIHECSICGSEFGSGQALGGHMRRHRAATVNTTTPTATTTTTSVNYNNTQSENKPILTLDLNLPAPEDDMSESKFQFGSTTTTTATTTQSGLVFSAPALIDCHY